MSARNIVTLLLLGSGLAFSQQPSGPSSKISVDSQTIIVTGTFEPIPLSEAKRSVALLDTGEQPLL
jgi:hypothetical protein